ncbi:20490_t:CDS:2, partial [Racocetra persica]
YFRPPKGSIPQPQRKLTENKRRGDKREGASFFLLWLEDLVFLMRDELYL